HTIAKRDWSSDVCSSDLALSDKAIEDHIKQKTTIGIFAGEFITKFLTFDVDGKKYADVMTLELVNTLVYEFDIDFNNILVTFSRSEERRVGKDARYTVCN